MTAVMFTARDKTEPFLTQNKCRTMRVKNSTFCRTTPNDFLNGLGSQVSDDNLSGIMKRLRNAQVK